MITDHNNKNVFRCELSITNLAKLDMSPNEIKRITNEELSQRLARFIMEKKAVMNWGEDESTQLTSYGLSLVVLHPYELQEMVDKLVDERLKRMVHLGPTW